MQYSLIIYASPANPSTTTALKFSKALLEKGHSIFRIFFYGEAVRTANALQVSPQNEYDLPAAWQGFIRDNSLDATVCIAAAIRRGVLDETEAKRYKKPSPSLANNYELSGLGQLAEAALKSDRLITFG